ncbi:hypothetical protein NHQ30_001439 [Ciborinia camelliae]|nr:hypothetical protein NHQ30_001439 [Ciborinia camelliae]
MNCNALCSSVGSMQNTRKKVRGHLISFPFKNDASKPELLFYNPGVGQQRTLHTLADGLDLTYEYSLATRNVRTTRASDSHPVHMGLEESFPTGPSIDPSNYVPSEEDIDEMMRDLLDVSQNSDIPKDFDEDDFFDDFENSQASIPVENNFDLSLMRRDFNENSLNNLTRVPRTENGENHPSNPDDLHHLRPIEPITSCLNFNSLLPGIPELPEYASDNEEYDERQSSQGPGSISSGGSNWSRLPVSRYFLFCYYDGMVN